MTTATAATTRPILHQRWADMAMRRSKPKSITLRDVSLPAGSRVCAFIDLENGEQIAVKGNNEQTLRAWLRKAAPQFTSRVRYE